METVRFRLLVRGGSTWMSSIYQLHTAQYIAVIRCASLHLSPLYDSSCMYAHLFGARPWTRITSPQPSLADIRIFPPLSSPLSSWGLTLKLSLLHLLHLALFCASLTRLLLLRKRRGARCFTLACLRFPELALHHSLAMEKHGGSEPNKEMYWHQLSSWMPLAHTCPSISTNVVQKRML